VIQDAKRAKELEQMIVRMGAITGVFRVRSDVIGCARFLAFQELMDVFVKLCRQTMAENKDFCIEALKVEDKDRADLISAFKGVFGAEPNAFFGAPAAEGE
jgi:hypothetical protein